MNRFTELVKSLLDESMSPQSRQQFLKFTGRTLAIGATGSLLTTYGQNRPPKSTPSAQVQADTVPRIQPVSPPVEIPAKIDEPIKLEPIRGDADRQTPPTPSPQPPDSRVGYAVVGLGHLSLENILPAFGECRKSKLVALVSGNPQKLQKVAQQYGVKPQNCYNYDTYDQLKDNPEVQVIYIVLPNAMHAEYTIRGAQAGKHILSEKPMAANSEQAQAMIDACNKAGRKLMVAYRIQYEPYNRYVREQVRQKLYGAPKYLELHNAQQEANPNHWRHIRALAGGGALPDIGLYCLNTARFLLGEEPTEVFAYQYSTPGNPLFREVEELVSWQMRFPSGVIANCGTDYFTHESRRYRVLAERGWLNVENAFAYNGLQMQQAYAVGQTEHRDEIEIMEKNQFATEMDHFSDCIQQNKQPFTPGEEGLQDHRIMEAIYQSAQEGRPVKLPLYTKLDPFRGPEPQLM
ncbi:Gfo/Idh/MocA family oxidoreductase [Spirosoma sp. RP8]|uniref:Gfo/Idh/MocA family oxidoreductase n=1 Tax=Spirosoma liriopis TaxID=2937440 RepID=A0ABT0HSB5_9BACT|nr:Gfo/Idh/MocA family oxidoreductase [Spirosoma liriopis]MCK8495078.1 Gfo/Idh/MocA family oxidoreductase [Spirosoma liriopis]